MKDAELMTTDATVPGLEVVPQFQSWRVLISGEPAGTFYAEGTASEFYAYLSGGRSTTLSFQTRNEAVKWILDQHKAKEDK